MKPLRAESLIRDIPDFPTPGILFKDITPALADPEALREAVDQMTRLAEMCQPDLVIGIESRGFIFGVPIALNLGLGFVPIRKLGKLPHRTVREEYALEYGSSTVEIHHDAIPPGKRVVIIDDLLATGGTAGAAARLVEKLGGKVCGFTFLVELGFLSGRSTLGKYRVDALIQYE